MVASTDSITTAGWPLETLEYQISSCGLIPLRGLHTLFKDVSTTITCPALRSDGMAAHGD